MFNPATYMFKCKIILSCITFLNTPSKIVYITCIAVKMADTAMAKILRKLHLETVQSKFEKEKITPDIVGKLCMAEFQMLGISNSSDMMMLRTECVKYGCGKLAKVHVSLQSGAPEFNIPKITLVNLLESGFLISEVAKLLSVSERTIYRRMNKYGLSKMTFSSITDQELDIIVLQTKHDFPLCGEKMIKQILAQKGIKIQRWRLRDSIHRIDSAGVQERKKRRLHRRVYNVGGPNCLWHIDTNHKLVRWRFIVAGGIDGFSRLIVFLNCSDNNKADTVFQQFLAGVDKYGIPLRVRSDKGLENVGIADYMLARRGSRGIITGKSTHNQRIERLWRDVFEGVLSYFYQLFYYMEDLAILDCLNKEHLLALHVVYMGEINRKLSVWSQAWNSHRLRSVKSSPQNLWMAGQLQNPIGLEEIDTGLHDESINEEHPEVEDDERPIFDPLAPALSHEDIQRLRAEIPHFKHHENFGINDYKNCLSIIQRFNQQGD